ncbi:MAG: DNA methyltransferase, partial [Candidatus Marinimicrobia bacterium]|nr:DNA methyltransferase [Candidatus Neomarinimicrobiota bacterium]
ATYDPERRERLGVYYTPEQVVRYIVRSVDYLLREKFHKSDGLADYSVKILDPAAGTMTFIGEAIRNATTSFVSKWGEGSKRQFIEDHILEDFYAFEYLMAPYVIGHLKIGLELEELGYELPEDRRFKFYLTNTLTMEELEASNIPLLREMTEEARSAQKVKSKETPILVVLGNPPYSVSSSNKSEWIENLMETYKSAVRGERNIQPLSDDYIKFIRFAHWKIVQTGHGIVGFITNNSYLSGLIHRGMRKTLLDDFDEIYILDLHGNARMGERAPDGSPDENVFDIMQGVAVALFVRHPDHDDEKPAKVFYHSLFGRREEKYDFLNSHDVSNTPWEELKPFEPYYFFVPKDFSRAAEYEKFWSVAEIFKLGTAGLETGRDSALIHFDKGSLIPIMKAIANQNISDKEIETLYGIRDTSGWNFTLRRKLLLKEGFDESNIKPVLYRPFDVRYTYYHSFLRRPQENVMRHMLAGENLGLLTVRQFNTPSFAHALCTDIIAERCSVSIRTRELAYLFPLYLYHISDEERLALHGDVEREPNLNPEFVRQIEQIVGKTTPERIFYYIYAVLYCPTYRERYQEFLRIDFPKIPLPPSAEAFEKFAEIGHRLVELHLLRAPELSNPVAKFHGEGDCVVQKIKYDPQKRRVWINKTQYFSPVEPEWWEYHIGGYQVLEKWLKDRRRRRLSLEESQTYCKIITAIEKTVELQGRLREIYRRLE